MARKDDLKEEATKLGISLVGSETIPELESLIATFPGSNNPDIPPTPGAGLTPDPLPPQTTPYVPEGERMVKLSDVKALIAEALANQAADANKPVKVKKVTEHHAHVWRMDGKWIIDFADRNWDYEKKEKIDPYVKEKIHAFQKFNEQKREFEAWITLILDDGTRKEMPLNRYVERRVLVYCKIIKRHKVDKSYSIGEVEKKKENGDTLIGTGVMVDQEVTIYGEVLEVETPEGTVLKLPDYCIC